MAAPDIRIVLDGTGHRGPPTPQHIDTMHFQFRAIAVVCLWLTATATAPAGPLVLDLWPGRPPDESAAIGAEYVRPSPKLDRSQVEVTESTRMITNVTRPTLSV